jgi:hypothetical protein
MYSVNICLNTSLGIVQLRPEKNARFAKIASIATKCRICKFYNICNFVKL